MDAFPAELVAAIIDLFKPLGGFVRWVFGGCRGKMTSAMNKQGNSWIGVFSVIAIALLIVVLGS